MILILCVQTPFSVAFAAVLWRGHCTRVGFGSGTAFGIDALNVGSQPVPAIPSSDHFGAQGMSPNSLKRPYRHTAILQK